MNVKKKRSQKKLYGEKQRAAWQVGLAAALLALALSLPFLPSPGWKFWNTEFIAFMLVMLSVPVLLLRQESRGSRWVRRLVLLVSLALFGFLQWACPRPTGAVELLLLGLLDDKPVLKFGLELGVILSVTLLYGRYFCGWICPKGALQEFIYRPDLSWRVPEHVDRVLKYGKYVSLAVLLLSPLLWHYRFFREYGPFKVIFNLDGSTLLVIFLVLVLLVSVFIERAWCRYLCPVGGLLGLVALLSPVRVRVAEDACNGCTLCARACPVGAISAPRGEVPIIAQQECLACMECEAVCPRSCITLSAVPAKILEGRKS